MSPHATQFTLGEARAEDITVQSVSQSVVQASGLQTPPDTPKEWLHGPSPTPKLGIEPEVENNERYPVLARGIRKVTQLRNGTDKPIALQQLQYRSWKYPISIYHYHDDLLPMQTFKSTLAREVDIWHHCRIGLDPLQGWEIPEGDEIPAGFTEVVYMPNLFQGKGSAIGFRDPEKDEVEFLCFTKPAEDLLKEAVTGKGENLCVLVATQEKDGRGEKGNPEHRAWYESVFFGQEKHVKLTLTWKNRDRDLKAAMWKSLAFGKHDTESVGVQKLRSLLRKSAARATNKTIRQTGRRYKI